MERKALEEESKTSLRCAPCAWLALCVLFPATCDRPEARRSAVRETSLLATDDQREGLESDRLGPRSDEERVSIGQPETIPAFERGEEMQQFTLEAIVPSKYPLSELQIRTTCACASARFGKRSNDAVPLDVKVDVAEAGRHSFSIALARDGDVLGDAVVTYVVADTVELTVTPSDLGECETGSVQLINLQVRGNSASRRLLRPRVYALPDIERHGGSVTFTRTGPDAFELLLVVPDAQHLGFLHVGLQNAKYDRVTDKHLVRWQTATPLVINPEMIFLSAERPVAKCIVEQLRGDDPVELVNPENASFTANLETLDHSIYRLTVKLREPLTGTGREVVHLAGPAGPISIPVLIGK